MSRRRRALSLSHGACPLPLLGDASHGELVARLQEIAGAIERPSAIVVVGAYWEERQPTITSVSTPPLLHVYSGFPRRPMRSSTPSGRPPAGAASRRHPCCPRHR